LKKSHFINIFISVLFLIFVNGCRVMYDIGDNTLRNFSSPAKVKNKIKDPIREGVKLSALWIGHATVLIQMDDKVILTDPFLTDHVAEIQHRIVEPGLDINVLKKLDIILISHSHPDHLCFGSLEILEKKFPGADLVFPDNVKEFIPDMKFKFHPLKKPDQENKIYEGETKIIDGIKITSVAAYHWGGRYGLDGFLWGYDGFCGFILEYKGMTVYFAGDTSYDKDFFKYLGTHYNIDVELIPIGPCKDCYKIDKKNRHVYPRGALKILDDTKAKLMIPIHYGTIAELSDPEKPKYVLEELINENPQYKDRINILKIGGQIIIK
jgi:N-acyl-phosphatidylethanolamine-hydrolysing phospholipase D